MKNSLLVTRPSYDDGTSYLFHYAKEVIDYAEEKNILVFDLIKPRLSRKIFTDIVTGKDPSLIFFNAHGDAACIYGDKIGDREEVLVEENVNHGLLTDRIVYARACYAAASLGDTCTRKGGCFIGYRSPFSFWVDIRRSATPLKDETARLFLEPSNLIVLSMLKGNTAQEAFEKSQNMIKKNILKLMRDKQDPEAMASIMLLWSNLSGQAILGEKEMRLS